MNILITSAGRRDYLVKWFLEALGEKGQIFVGNSHGISPCFTLTNNHILTPSIYDDQYVPFLMEFCEAHKIKAIVPLHDCDVEQLNLQKEKFSKRGINILGPTAQSSMICHDKWSTYKFLTEASIDTAVSFISLEKSIRAIELSQVSFPLILKPRWGMGSINILVAHDLIELHHKHELLIKEIQSDPLFRTYVDEPRTSVIIQEKLNGQEYGLDVLNDFGGNPVCVVPKIKLSMRSGETDAAQIIEDPELKKLGSKIGALLGHSGNLDIDVFVDNDRTSILELNCRFGGGYPFSHVAGVNFPGCIVAWLLGEIPLKKWMTYKSGTIGVKGVSVAALKKHSD